MAGLYSYKQRNWRWNMLPLITLIAFLSCSGVNGTVVCETCHPVSIQEAPGVGLSLAPSYGSLSIRFANGSVSDLAFVRGTEAYRQAMKRLQRVDTEPLPLQEQPVYESDISMSLLHRLQSWFQGERPVQNLPQPIYDELVPIAEMMRALYATANASVPISNRVYLTIPDVGSPIGSNIQRSIDYLVKSAGLDTFRHGTQSQLSLQRLYNLESCYGIWLDEFTEVPDYECEKYQGTPIHSVLSIYLDDFAVNFRSMVRDDGVFYFEPDSAKLLWTDENEIQNNVSYWNWVEDKLREFLHEHNVNFDMLLLSGHNVTSDSFQNIIQDTFKDNNKIVPQDYLRSVDDHVFAASRGAAMYARMGMCGSYNGCVLNYWCPVVESCKGWVWRFENVEETEADI